MIKNCALINTAMTIPKKINFNPEPFPIKPTRPYIKIEKPNRKKDSRIGIPTNINAAGYNIYNKNETFADSASAL